MKAGDIIHARVRGTVISLTLEDRVLPDRSCFQYEAGWWAYTESERQYFVQDDGLVYSSSTEWPDRFDVEVGDVEETQ